MLHSTITYCINSIKPLLSLKVLFLVHKWFTIKNYRVTKQKFFAVTAHKLLRIKVEVFCPDKIIIYFFPNKLIVIYNTLILLLVLVSFSLLTSYLYTEIFTRQLSNTNFECTITLHKLNSCNIISAHPVL